MHETRQVLVLGATGGIGGETVRALARHGWHVAAFARKPPHKAPAADEGGRITWIAGDAMNAGDVRRAAEGASVIVHAVNPAGYRRWGELVLPMIDNTIAAAGEVGARIVLPGNIYNYGHDAFPLVAEDAPQNPVSAKGSIRVALERRLQAASRSGTPALIVRFGDFFGPASGSDWFSQGLVKPGRRLGAVTWPGEPGVGHTWAYLPDAAEILARLLDRMDELAPFERFHAEGHWDADGTRMLQTIASALGRPGLPTRRLPWGAPAAGRNLARDPARDPPDALPVADARPARQHPPRRLSGRGAAHPAA